MRPLRRINLEQICLSEEQSQQLRDTHQRLRRLNRAVLAHLRQVRLHSSDKQYHAAGRLLGIEASQMKSLLGFREQIIQSGGDQKPKAMILTDGWRCRTCSEDRPAQPESQPAKSPGVLKSDPAWQSEIDCVLKVASRTEARAFERCLSRGNVPSGFFSALDRLKKALLQQKFHLLQTTPEQTTEVDWRLLLTSNCAGCGQPQAKDEGEARRMAELVTALWRVSQNSRRRSRRER
jgi:hypothetical protein